MKKINVILPVLVLVVALLAGTVMTLYTTNFIKIGELVKSGQDVSKIDYEYIRKTADTRCKLEPCPDAYDMAFYYYSPYLLLQEKNNGKTLPDDCFEKGIMYAEKMLALEFGQYPQENAIYGSEGLYEANFRSQYIWLLYLNGETETAKKETEKYIDSLDEDTIGSVNFLSSFFCYVYYEGEPSDKIWVLETEQFISEKAKAFGVTKNFINAPIDYSYALPLF